jgi:hypothetical protein
LKLPPLPSAAVLNALHSEDSLSTQPSQYANSVRFKVKLTAADLEILKEQCNKNFIAGFTAVANTDSWYHVFIQKEKLYNCIAQLVVNSNVKSYLTQWPRESGNDNKICTIQ